MKKKPEFKPDWANYRQGLKDGRAEALAEVLSDDMVSVPRELLERLIRACAPHSLPEIELRRELRALIDTQKKE